MRALALGSDGRAGISGRRSTSSSSSSSSSSSRRHGAACSSCPMRPQQQQQQRHHTRAPPRRTRLVVTAAAAAGDDNDDAAAAPGSGSEDLSSAFAAELAARQVADAEAAERAAAAAFDGAALLALLRQKYRRSYDVSLVSRTYLGKDFVALNVMWKYAEQQSWLYTPEQYAQRLDYVAAALRSWGVVGRVQQQLLATKERPRVGKAVSIMLDVPRERAKEWIAA